MYDSEAVGAFVDDAALRNRLASEVLEMRSTIRTSNQPPAP